jgi:hypothetical protein
MYTYMTEVEANESSLASGVNGLVQILPQTPALVLECCRQRRILLRTRHVLLCEHGGAEGGERIFGAKASLDKKLESQCPSISTT